jgi:hypothetical protein
LEDENTTAQIDVVTSSTGETGSLFTECCSATLRKAVSDILEMMTFCNVSNSESGDLNKDHLTKSTAKQDAVKLNHTMMIKKVATILTTIK